jgi:pyruvate dehydrogenase E1 component alpha subunit
MGGHMHLFSPEKLAASSGIVGSTGPSAVGFALAGQYLRPGAVTLAFFGEGAVNEGMLMESLNMAVIWSLPIIFICKDNGWSITTPSSKVTAGSLIQRAQAFDMEAAEVDGGEVIEVWRTASEAIERARQGGGPTFIRATCRHFEGHFLGYQALRLVRKPHKELTAVWPYIRASLNLKGAPVNERVSSVRTFIKMLLGVRKESLAIEDDPVRRTRRQLINDGAALNQLEAAVIDEIHDLLERTVP